MRFKKKIGNVLVILILIVIFASTLSYGQRLTGKIVGIVTDKDSDPLPGVTVELSGAVMMGGIHTQLTSGKGTYRFTKLPPGMYKLIFSLDGFQTVEQHNIKVEVDGTVTKNIVLKQSSISETVTVTAESPPVDVTKPGLASIYGKENIEQIPKGRGMYYEIVKQAPGMVSAGIYSGSDAVSAYGSNYESNAFQVDGVDVNIPDIGTAWISLHQEMVAEVETTGVGSAAEYGNYTGAVVNVVTKSGGNIIEGNLAYYGQFQGLTGDNNPDPEEYFSYNRNEFFDVVFALGGPIVKDKLWFFASADYLKDGATQWNQDPEYSVSQAFSRAFLKFSSMINQRHKLVASFMYDRWYVPQPKTPTYTEEALIEMDSPTIFWNASYTWLASHSTFFELKYAGYWSFMDAMPRSGGSIHNPVHLDLMTGVISGAPIYPWEYWGSRHQINTNLSHFAEDFIGGDHDFKVGVQYNHGWSQSDAGYSAGKFYLDYMGYPYLLYEQQPWYYGGTINTLGVFFDDSWTISNRLTVTLGIRYDHSTGSYPELTIMDGWEKTSDKVPASAALITWNSVSPRFGFAYQLTSDQKTVLRGSFGRYYSYLHSGSFMNPGPAVTDLTMYLWTGSGWYPLWSIPGEIGYVIDPGLKNPYADQFQIGIERELFPNLSVGASYVYKNEKNLIGNANKAGIYERIDVISPDNGQTYNAYNQINVGTNEIWLTNPEDFMQKYNGFILSLNKRYSDKWLLNASLTYSKAEAFTQGAHGVHGGAGGSNIVALYHLNYGRDPNDWINAKGAARQDRRWVVKVAASYTLPLDILASIFYSYHSGQPRPTFVRINTNQGLRQILAEPRGENKFDSINMLDLRIQKTFGITSRVRLDFLFDLFNVFNTDTTLQYQTYNLWASNYLTPNSIPQPRRLQIGCKLSF